MDALDHSAVGNTPGSGRRLFLAGVLVLIAAPRVEASERSVPWRIGYLSVDNAIEEEPDYNGFRQGLKGLGYVEGKSIIIEFRGAEGRLEALSGLAEEFVRLKVDVILASSTYAARAAKQATSSIPIVFSAVSDPVGSGLVVSLPQPGGNVTGIMDYGVDLTGKRLDLLKHLLPQLKRVAFLGYPDDTLWAPVWSEAQTASRKLRIDIVPMPFSSEEQLDIAFRNVGSRVEALLVAPQPFIYTHRRRIFELALQGRLPAIYEFRHYPAHGGLLSYGPVYPALYRKAARLVDAILKGTRPADLPVELPTEFELVLNLRTAKAMGLTIPERFMQAVDEVIQ